jgi:nucleotide-binding universal stress UspA family protein
MIRRILLPLDNSKYTKTGLKFAKRIAKRTGAEISGMVILDLKGIDDAAGPYVPGGGDLVDMLEKKEQQEAQEHIEALLDEFKTSCAEDEVKHREFEYQGSPSNNIIKESFFYDMLIIGMRTFFHFETSNLPGDSLEKILDHTVTPIFAVPDHYKKIEKVLVVGDKNNASFRALQRFSHIAENSGYEISLLMKSNNEKEADFFLTRAEEYLRAYGMDKIEKEWTNESLREVIEKKFLDKVDMIVIGSHQHKSLKEFVVGTLENYLIKANVKPVFIVQ